MPNIESSHYQKEYSSLIPKSIKVTDVRADVSLYLFDNRIYLLVKDDNIVLGNITISQKLINGKKYIHIDGIFLPIEYRKTSAPNWLIYAVKETMMIPVIANGAIFSDGSDLIDAIIKHKVFNVSKLDVNTGEKLELTGKINDPAYCYLFESAKLGFNTRFFENMAVTWLPLFEEIII